MPGGESSPDLTPWVPQVLVRRPPDAARHWTVEGTTVFIDISGFTSLSEQLARRGRVGAEHLVSTLTRIFTLLMSATDDGGDVVKFAGDALLVMYTGPDHERHACHAAATAQRLLAVVGQVNLDGARERLRMSVGVHSGRFEMMLTGRDTSSLVIAGPALDTVLALQDGAAPGQVLVSTATAATLSAGSLGARVDVGDPPVAGVLLRRPPPVESVGRVAAGLGIAGRVGDLGRYLPRVFNRRPDLLDADSDHRRAAMAFVQVAGLGPHLDADPLAVIDPVTAVVEEACQATGVTLLDTDIARDGYRYFLTAGAPVGVEDAEGRLLRALVTITSTDSPLDIRAGASSGQVFAGPVGPSFRRTFSVMGDTTNLAARLTAQAPRRAVLVHQATTRRSATTFEETPHAPVCVKGKVVAVPVTVVGKPLGPRQVSVDSEPPLMGRDDEVERLAAALDDARRGSSSGVLVVGDAGVGKSRLVSEVLGRSATPGVRVDADPYGAQVPYRAVGLLVRALLDSSREESPETLGARLTDAVARVAPRSTPWLRLLGDVLGLDLPMSPTVDELDQRFRSARLHAALSELVVGLVRDGEVLVVDNAQWVDPSSLEALSALGAAIVDRPCALLLAGRVPVSIGGHAEPIVLRPLDAEAASRLVSALSPRRRESRVLSIVHRGDGNPFLLAQLAGAADGPLPDTVEEAVGLRIDELGAHDRDLLRQAAVLGSRFTTRLFAHTTGLADLPGLIGSVSSDLDGFLTVHEDGTVAFRRELEREVAYGQLTYRRRRETHRSAAEAIEADVGPGADLVDAAARLPLLSLHRFEGADWPAAYRWSRRAAEQAQAQYANDEAAAFARRALEAGRRTGVDRSTLGEVEERLGDVLVRAGEHAAATRALQGARRATREPLRVAELTYKIGMVHREAGRLRAAIGAAGQVSRLATGLPGARGVELEVEADLLRAGVRFWQGRCRACQQLTDRAARRTGALAPGPGRTGLLARAHALHDTASIELEGRAGRYGHEPLEMFREVGDLYNEGRFAVNLAVGEYYEGRWTEAVRMYRRSLEIAERIGDVFGAAVAEMNIGEVLALQGRPESVPPLTRSVTELRALGSPLATAHATLYLGVALRLGGDLAAARRCLVESAARFAEAGRDGGFSLDDLRSRDVELMVAEGRQGEAKDAVDALLERSPAPAVLHRARLLRSRAQARRALGDPAAAVDIDESLAVAGEVPLGYEAALTLMVRAGWDGDAQTRAQASEILAGLGCDVGALAGPDRGSAPVVGAGKD